MTTEAQNNRHVENRGTALIVAATAYGALAVLGFQIVASRSLGATLFAPIAVLWTAMFLLYTVLMLPAEQHLTRALVVTRASSQLHKIRRDMSLSFLASLFLGVTFVLLTLERFFLGNPTFLVVAALIVITRSIMATARGNLAGNRRFASYGVSIGLEGSALIVGGLIVAALGGDVVAFSFVVALAPLAILLSRPFRRTSTNARTSSFEAQPSSFLAWLVLATAAGQLIIAGGPIAVSFIGGDAIAVSIFFTSFALLRGPLTSSYSLVARVLPDFTVLAQGTDPQRLWKWGPRIAIGGYFAALVAGISAAFVLPPIVGLLYGDEFSPPRLAAALGGAGVALGLGALFASQMYTAAALGTRLALAWATALGAALFVLATVGINPIERVALGFAAGEATALLLLGVGFIQRFGPARRNR